MKKKSETGKGKAMENGHHQLQPADDGGGGLNKKRSWCLARTLMGELGCQQPSALADHSGAPEAVLSAKHNVLFAWCKT